METKAEVLWRMFACTGSIDRYLDYKQAAEIPPIHPAEGRENGELCHHGSGSAGNTL